MAVSTPSSTAQQDTAKILSMACCFTHCKLAFQVEDFYFSSAAGRARIVLGNRRWGENGYVASGRQQARPVQRTPKVCLVASCYGDDKMPNMCYYGSSCAYLVVALQLLVKAMLTSAVIGICLYS